MRIAGAFVMFACLGFIVLGMTSISRFGATTLHYENVYVVQSVGDYDYWFRINGRETYASICRDDTVPQFDKGETITDLWVKDLGSCWSYKGIHPAWYMLRDQNGKLIRKDN